MPLSDDYTSYLTEQEKKEKKHSSHVKYSIEDYSVTPAEIEVKLSEFYQQYQWPRANEQQTATGN
ncbi:MAG: hypothetical protein ACR2PS_17160 [Pseudomonadales bacterium]